MGRKSILKGYIGTSFDVQRWLSLDNCGLICITLSFSFLTYALIEVYTRLLSNDTVARVIFGVFYAPFTVLSMTSLFMAWTSNPGAVPMGARPLKEDLDLEANNGNNESKTANNDAGTVTSNNEEQKAVPPKRSKPKRGIKRCRKCNDNFKPPRAHHDSVTGRCIVKMDHFCPWICNAVGVLNHKFFFLFILYTCLTCVTCLILIIVQFIYCGASTPSDDQFTFSSTSSSSLEPTFIISKYLRNKFFQDADMTNPSCQVIFTSDVTFLFFLALLYMMFTSCMLFDQVEAVRSNISKIARMKLERENIDVVSASSSTVNSELGRVSNQFNEIFGGTSIKIAWHWFFPIPIRFPEGMYDAVMGYEYDSSFGDEPYRPTRQNNSATANMCSPVNSYDNLAGAGSGSLILGKHSEGTIYDVDASDSLHSVSSQTMEPPSQSISNPVETVSVVDASPLLRSEASSGVKRRNTKQEEEHVSLLSGQPQNYFVGDE